jgi:hypothetical protein
MLRVFAEERAASGGLRLWWGLSSDLLFEELAPPLRIAKHFGLGLDTGDTQKALRQIEAEAAGKLLHSLSTVELERGVRSAPPDRLLRDIAAGLEALGPQAQFYTNVDWNGRLDDANFGYHPMSNSRHDAGLVGYNDEVGFLVWIEEN